MKLITINVTDEEHQRIKLAATQASLSIKEYLLGKPQTRPVTIAKSPEQIIKAIKEKPVSMGFKPCKHGSDPNFCKFAKPGKPCK